MNNGGNKGEIVLGIVCAIFGGFLGFGAVCLLYSDSMFQVAGVAAIISGIIAIGIGVYYGKKSDQGTGVKVAAVVVALVCMLVAAFGSNIEKSDYEKQKDKFNEQTYDIIEDYYNNW